MRIFHALKRMSAGAIAGAMLLASAAVMPTEKADAANLCTINTNKTYQVIRGFGGINLPEWAGSDMTSAQVQKAFGNGADEMGLSILRIYVSDDKNMWSRAVPTAKAAQNLGATVFASPWNPPKELCNSGGSTSKYVLPKSNYGAYAQHLNNYVKYMEGQGINLYSVSVQNEPDCCHDWTGWKPAELVDFIANYGKQVTAGTNAKLMSPESFQYIKDIYNAILNNKQALANIDLFATHFYGTLRSQMDFPALENSGKDIWMTEVYVPNSDDNSADRWPEGVKVAENIHNGLVVGNMNAYVWWYIRRQYGPMKENGEISKRGYALAQYSKWIRPGDIRIDVTEQPNSDILVSAYKHSDKQITVVAVNKGSNDVTQQFSASGRSITNIDRYRTSGSENIALTKNMEHDTSSFWATLPANSVSTFVVTMESDGIDVPHDGQSTKQEPLVPDGNGYYFHDTFEGSTNSWAGRGSAEIETSGRVPYQGSEALLIKNREKAWNGAQKALHSATFVGGKEYSFSVDAYFDEGEATQKIMLSLQYTDSSGETKYDHIAQATAVSGSYVQLANSNYTIPDGAVSPVLYIETESGTGNIYIDEAIGAIAGTKIDGPQEIKYLPGDVNSDGIINTVDLTIAKRYLGKAFPEPVMRLAADMNQSGEVDAEDILWFNEFLTGKTV